MITFTTFFLTKLISFFTPPTAIQSINLPPAIVLIGSILELVSPDLHQISIAWKLSVCPADPEVMYVLGALGGAASDVYISNDGGESWISRVSPSVPPYPGCPDVACGQAGYDLDIAVDPFNCGHLVVGGITLWESALLAVSWQKYIFESQTIGDYHYDQHAIYFDTKKQGRIYYGNDGGIFMSDNNGQTAEDKNLGYATTQFYCGAIHPESGSPYVLGEHRITDPYRSLNLDYRLPIEFFLAMVFFVSLIRMIRISRLFHHRKAIMACQQMADLILGFGASRDGAFQPVWL